MTMPMSTNTTMAACIQIQVGDIGSRQDRRSSVESDDAENHSTAYCV